MLYKVRKRCELRNISCHCALTLGWVSYPKLVRLLQVQGYLPQATRAAINPLVIERSLLSWMVGSFKPRWTRSKIWRLSGICLFDLCIFLYIFIWEIGDLLKGTNWARFMVLQPTPNKDLMLFCHAFLRQGESGKGGTPQIKEKKRSTNITSNKKAPNPRRCKFQKAIFEKKKHPLGNHYHKRTHIMKQPTPKLQANIHKRKI